MTDRFFDQCFKPEPVDVFPRRHIQNLSDLLVSDASELPVETGSIDGEGFTIVQTSVYEQPMTPVSMLQEQPKI